MKKVLLLLVNAFTVVHELLFPGEEGDEKLQTMFLTIDRKGPDKLFFGSNSKKSANGVKIIGYDLNVLPTFSILYSKALIGI